MNRLWLDSNLIASSVRHVDTEVHGSELIMSDSQCLWGNPTGEWRTNVIPTSPDQLRQLSTQFAPYLVYVSAASQYFSDVVH